MREMPRESRPDAAGERSRRVDIGRVIHQSDEDDVLGSAWIRPELGEKLATSTPFSITAIRAEGASATQLLTLSLAANDVSEGILQNFPLQRGELGSGEAGIPALRGRRNRRTEAPHRFRFDVVPVVDDRALPGAGCGFAITNHVNAVEVDQVERSVPGQTLDCGAHFRWTCNSERALASVRASLGISFAGP